MIETERLILRPFREGDEDDLYAYLKEPMVNCFACMKLRSLDEAVAARAAALTIAGFSALRLGGYARFDYLLDEAGELWCLEANTLPGMTPTSLLPFAASKKGISYNELCEKLVNLAFQK